MRCATILALVWLACSGGPPAIAADAGLIAGEHEIDLGDVRLHYVVRGQGPLLFVASPGWGVGSNYLQIGLAPLEMRMTLVYIDMRGNGGSTQPADRSQMSQAVMADDIDGLRQRLGLDSIDLFGHSDGGTIAIEYAVRHPQHLRKLLLIAPSVLGDKEPKSLPKLWAGTHVDPEWHGRLDLFSSSGATIARRDSQFRAASLCQQGAHALDRGEAAFLPRSREILRGWIAPRNQCSGPENVI